MATDPFERWRAFSQARIGLGRVGDSLPTRAHLELREAHARARDAVHRRVDFDALARALPDLAPQRVRSQAGDRAVYLRRPDWGRRLSPESRAVLQAQRGAFEVAVVVADGLSASAIDARAVPLVRALRDELAELRWAPLVLAEQARVALGDEVGEVLGAELVVVLIGERPGLSVSDSVGLYVTHAPAIGRSDAERNCISNVHDGGLGIVEAAQHLAALVRESRRLGTSGVKLKLEAPEPALVLTGSTERP
ncbi:MAG TPA: ethanolamine ammonia-lyase subunit EutC [Polyangiaceae bacterium]|nr:ethanolamine ammonia-lyase subunit EutC [Polyangiaceae bacterium]